MAHKIIVTSFDIAERVGVAQSTVSRALRGDKGVSNETRTRISDAARELNYVVNRHASHMRLKKTFTLALVVIYRENESVATISPFHNLLIGRIAEAAAAKGYNLLISFQNSPENLYGHYEDSHLADGLIVIGTSSNPAAWDYFAALSNRDRSIIAWGAPDMAFDSVSCDNVVGGELATRHLIELGRRNIVFLGTKGRLERQFRERMEGYLIAMNANGFNPVALFAKDDLDRTQQGYQATQQHLQAGGAIDAVFAASDLLAFGAMRAITAHGLKIPHDVAVVGFDGVPAGRTAYPSLTTIEPDLHAAGALLVHNLLEKLDGEHHGDERISVRLAARESSTNV